MKRKNFKQNHRNKNAGQALIEFVLGLMIVISFFFFYVKMAAVFAIGNYVHYATFMAARAYASSAGTEDAQKANAETVLQKMLGGRFKSAIKPKGGSGSITGAYVGPGDYAQQNAAEDSWNQGVTFSYETKLSLYPWSRDGQSIVMDLTSESWMPREESVSECVERRNKIAGSVSANANATIKMEWDNGC